jgi:hypothetical protein
LSNFKRFYLFRHEDESGVSGTGVVAHGVQFQDGAAALRWFGPTRSTGFYDSIEDLIDSWSWRKNGS